MRARASVVRGLCIVFMLVLGLSMSACTVVGFFSGVAATNKREARLNARATSEERAACRARRKEQIEHAHEAGEDADPEGADDASDGDLTLDALGDPKFPAGGGS